MSDLHLDETRATATPIFENAEWSVLPEGLEHRASGYFIARDVVGMRRGDLWEWPLHLAEKSWCRPLSFREAFVAAVSAFGVARDSNLAPSFAIGFGLKAGPVATKAADGFVVLADVIRPKARKPEAARKRNVPSEGRGAGRRSGVLVSQRVADAAVQRVCL